MIFSYGGKYDGGFKNGKPDGYGIFSMPNGLIYRGDWKDGALRGKVRCVFSDGVRYVGCIENAKPHGRGTFFYSSGKSHGGKWENGVLIEKDQNSN